MAKSGIGTVLGKNARGGIDKLSNREARGDRRIGSTGRINKEEHIDTYKELSNPSLKQRSAQWAIDNGTVPGVIPATALTPEKAIKLPSAPEPTDPGVSVAVNNAALGAEATGIFPPTETTPTANIAEDAPINALMEMYNSAANELPNMEQMRRDIEAEAGYRPALAEEARIQGQLNALQSQAEADKIRLEQEGSDTDITKNRYMGQVSRINREVAIQSLPLQAQLAAAQGRVELAQDYVNTMFQVRMTDAQNQFNFKMKVADAVYDRMTKLEQRQFDKILREEERSYEEERELLQNAQNAVNAAVASGGASPTEVSQLMKLPPEQQIGLANSILARTAVSDRDLARTAKYSSIQHQQTMDLLALAEAGDPNAIKRLGFDPRSSGGNFEAETALRKEFNALGQVKDAQSIQQSYQQIVAASLDAASSLNSGGSPSAADQALIISFNKMLDPTSVVREGEFARSVEGQSTIQAMQAKIERMQRGGAGLTANARNEIVELSRTLYADYLRMYNDKAFNYRQNALRQNADPNYVAVYMDTTGILNAQDAREGDVLFLNGSPFMRSGDEFIKIDI